MEALDYTGLSHFHDKEMEEFNNYPDKEELAFVNRRFKRAFDRFNGQAWDTETGASPAYSHVVPDGGKLVDISWIGGNSDTSGSSLVSAIVTSVVSKSEDATTLGIFTIPEELLELDGYGQSNGTDYNVVDFANKLFRKKGSYNAGGTWVADVEDIDISEYLDGVETMLKTEAGGSVIFVQEDGTELSVPNEVFYAVELAET